MTLDWIKNARTAWVAAALCGPLLLNGQARAADASPGRFWADFGVGYGNMNSSSAPVAVGGGGLWVDAQIGAHISSRWLAGVDIGGLGMQPSSNNYQNENQDIYGQGITNVFLVIQYEPKSDHGWFVGGGAGQVLYSNKTLDDFTGNTRSGSGRGAIARIGYDWRYSNRGHFETTLGYEAGNIGLYAPVGGSFRYSIVALSFHLAYH
jgi:hypothetical protein